MSMPNDLTPRPTPAQRYGRELARHRNAAGLSQTRLAFRLGVSPSLISHIERGTRNPGPGFAKRCDEFFDTGDLFTRLCRDITASARPVWFADWLDEIEPRARVLRSWDPLLIPGLVQTEAYARAVFAGGPPLTEQELQERVDTRMQRKTILDRADPPELWILLDEWVLKRPLGGPRTMADQLAYLIEIANRRHVTVQIVPYDSPCTDGLLSAFTIAELPDASTAVFVESAGNGEASAEYELVTAIWGQYDRMRAQAYRPHDSLSLIKEAQQRWHQKT